MHYTESQAIHYWYKLRHVLGNWGCRPKSTPSCLSSKYRRFNDLGV